LFKTAPLDWGPTGPGSEFEKVERVVALLAGPAPQRRNDQINKPAGVQPHDPSEAQQLV
jgi:hypothetical protein